MNQFQHVLSIFEALRIIIEFSYHDIFNRMTLQDNVTLLDPFTHTLNDRKKIMGFDFIREKKSEKREKVRIEETFCTLVAVGGEFLEEKRFKEVLKKVDEIRKIIGIKIL